MQDKLKIGEPSRDRVEYGRKYRALIRENPQANREYIERGNERAHKSRYGLSLVEKAQMATEQGGRCAICRGEFSLDDLVIDHCHVTGLIRGLLCYGCNNGLGNFHDNPNTMESAAKYIMKYVQLSFAEGESVKTTRKPSVRRNGRIDPNENLFD